MDTDATAAAEELVAGLSEQLTAPQPGECLLCYVDRMLDEFGCDCTLRWALRWRDRRLPRATGLVRRLGERGVFCDCEVFLNGWRPAAEDQTEDDGTDDDGGLWAVEPVPCAGVDRRSSQPCARWVPHRRPW